MVVARVKAEAGESAVAGNHWSEGADQLFHPKLFAGFGKDFQDQGSAKRQCFGHEFGRQFGVPERKRLVVDCPVR